MQENKRLGADSPALERAQPDEASDLTASDLEAFHDLLIEWSVEGENPYSLEAGAVGDSNVLAVRSFRWAKEVLRRGGSLKL